MRTRNVVGALAIVLLGLAGCGTKSGGGDGIASANGGTGSATPSAQQLSEQQRQVKFAQCMREHGVKMPDPKVNTHGGVQIDIPPGTSKSTVDKATAACRQYLPNGGEPPKVDPKITEQLRKMAQCMRAHGITKFPDPKPDGGILISGDLGIDPNSPSFKAAEKACQQYAPAPPEGGSGPNQSTDQQSSGSDSSGGH